MCIFVHAYLVFQVDKYNHLIRKLVLARPILDMPSVVSISAMDVTTLAGQQGVTSPFADGIGTAATFHYTVGIAINRAGTEALVVSTTAVYRTTARLGEYLCRHNMQTLTLPSFLF
jgi:hypothetical protein